MRCGLPVLPVLCERLPDDTERHRRREDHVSNLHRLNLPCVLSRTHARADFFPRCPLAPLHDSAHHADRPCG
jgi:hypothetical protein